MRDGWSSTTWGDIAYLEYGKSLKDHQNSAGEFPAFSTNGPIGFTDKPITGGYKVSATKVLDQPELLADLSTKSG